MIALIKRMLRSEGLARFAAERAVPAQPAGPAAEVPRAPRAARRGGTELLLAWACPIAGTPSPDERAARGPQQARAEKCQRMRRISPSGLRPRRRPERSAERRRSGARPRLSVAASALAPSDQRQMLALASLLTWAPPCVPTWEKSQALAHFLLKLHAQQLEQLPLMALTLQTVLARQLARLLEQAWLPALALAMARLPAPLRLACLSALALRLARALPRLLQLLELKRRKVARQKIQRWPSVAWTWLPRQQKRTRALPQRQLFAPKRRKAAQRKIPRRLSDARTWLPRPPRRSKRCGGSFFLRDSFDLPPKSCLLRRPGALHLFLQRPRCIRTLPAVLQSFRDFRLQ
eukprot:TRINITY_DN24699_c0_g1_i2.p1 TRINITY_DN24699_c0_g1~~TRINITY_DN24699_c0_g1_i2.p1  ORF type:complete len:355 (+),score=56.30 TRINITY_DN24699_c0_g1_i2:24-1067(+)